MDWSFLWYLLIPAAGILIDIIVGMTPPTWKPFGIPVGKYDGIIWAKFKAAWKARKEPKIDAGV